MRSSGSLWPHFCSRPQLYWDSAAGSDDKVVLLYELKGGKAVAAFGSSDGPNLENWRVGKHMRGHDGQVGPRHILAFCRPLQRCQATSELLDGRCSAQRGMVSGY